MRRTPGIPFTATVCLVLAVSATTVAVGQVRLNDGTSALLPDYAGSMFFTSVRDTVTLLGGPDRFDGRFETPEGDADLQGWQSRDYTITGESMWQISTFHADSLGGHGPGNLAMWCGQDFGGGVIGYGNDWQQKLQWTWPVANPADTSHVTLEAFVNHDTEPGFDDLTLSVARGGTWSTLASYEGWRIDRAVAITFAVAPGDYVGTNGDEIQVRWTFSSDSEWSDEDGLYPTDGGCQLDDIRMTVDGVLATYDDFEAGSPVSWVPVLDAGVGDFAHLAMNLQELDPCRADGSWQLCFIDDGNVVAGTGGSSCIQWCYGPGGYVLNSTGGLVGADHHLDDGVASPPLAWVDGCSQALLSFDVWRHEPLLAQSPGMLYHWRVRSTADVDSTALEAAQWQERDVMYYGAPKWLRQEELFGDLLVAGRKWVQVELGVRELGWLWGLDGHDATPAPYFDNVAVKAWPVDAPMIAVAAGDLPQDTFPSSGVIDLVDLSQDGCRFDMARSINPLGSLVNDPGDSIVATVAYLRDGAIAAGPPRMVVRLRPNPLFNPYRYPPPNPQGYVQVTSQGTPCQTPQGETVPNRWFFDLPDSTMFFPGDVVHFYFEASDFADGSIGTSRWPADTTGFSVFGENTPYPPAATMRALPTLFSQAFGDQPPILLWEDYASGDRREMWDLSLQNLGMHEGVQFDRFLTRDPAAGAGNGLGGRATLNEISGYRTLLYSSGDHVRATLGDGVTAFDPSTDLQLVRSWVEDADGHALLCGDNLASSLASAGGTATTFLASVMGTQVVGSDITSAVGGQISPLVLPLAANPVFTSLASWRAVGSCPQRRRFDLLMPDQNGQALAEYAGPQGQGGVYPYAAVVLNVAAAGSGRVITLPMALAAVGAGVDADGDGVPLVSRTRLLGDVLTYFGEVGGTVTDVPPSRELSVRNYPNPFNPTTTIAYNLPVAGEMSLKIYDLHGRLVKVLLRGKQPAGPGAVTWDGTDQGGRGVASGIYVHELRSDGKTVLGKMALVR